LESLISELPELCYAQYNYTPPIHLAVREGQQDVVALLLENGGYDPNYKTYPFQDSLETIALERGHFEIAERLKTYVDETPSLKYRGDNGSILFQRSEMQQAFEKAVYDQDLNETRKILSNHPEFAKDETYFWGEGIMLFAAKENNREMIDLLMQYGARVPPILKWAQFYYFEHPEGSRYMMEKGMDANTMSWQRVTILHDMAQKGNIEKAELLLNYGAHLNAIDEEYQSTPLGMAARWGHPEMVALLLSRGADPNKAGAEWARPLSWARTKRWTEIEKKLLTAGAK
jgi:ankyrin repeat protein